jgi:hypothetical protein
MPTTLTALRQELKQLLSRRHDNHERIDQANKVIARQLRAKKRYHRHLHALRGKIHRVRHRIRLAGLAAGPYAAIKWASDQVGTTEHPPGSNGGPKVSKWQSDLGFGRVPWCGIFVGTALKHAGVQGVTSRIAGVSLIEEDAKAGHGPFTGWGTASSAKPGDAVVLFGYGVHVELVVKNNGSSLETIGGNTSFGDGSQSNGGCVAHRTRSYSDVRGVAHVNYGG